MPIYEYRCSSCSHELESLQKFSDAPLKTCPSCGADHLVKLMSAAGFQLKGSGWYATDFKNGSKKPGKPAETGNDSKAEATTESKSGEKSESNTDSKAESKPESKSDSKSNAKSESKSESKSEAKAETKTERKSEPKTSPTPPTGSAG